LSLKYGRIWTLYKVSSFFSFFKYIFFPANNYCSEARALSRLVVTTDYPPMSEFVTDGESGILIYSHNPPEFESYQLLGDLARPMKAPSMESICNSIERVMKISVEERMRLGENARKRYEEDTNLMISKMQALSN
jgi:glycosyltransferase involved in cell wall biosynthesis